jgi:hypothetical protein
VPLSARGDAAPAAVENLISYTLPDDAPIHTIIGATTVQGPRIPVDPSTPTVVKPRCVGQVG